LNILFLIGNGFDINLGLKTSFSNVLDKYIKEEFCNNNIKLFQEVLKKYKFDWWSDFELELGRYAINFNKDDINIFTFQIDHFRKYFISKIKDEEQRIFSDIKRYNKKNKISKIFMRDISNFYNYFPVNRREAARKSIYFSDVDSYINYSYFYYDFITFNYTRVLDLIVEMSRISSEKEKYINVVPGARANTIEHKIGDIIHIHGTLATDFIMGVDNINQICNQELKNNTDFISKLVKPIMNEQLGRNTATNAINMINSSFIICIFGMSIGKTDKTWWDYILLWLKSDNNRHLIIFYHKPNIDITLANTIIETMEEAINKLYDAVEPYIKTVVQKCRDRIHIIVNKRNIFNIF
jgi:hypothetical protein